MHCRHKELLPSGFSMPHPSYYDRTPNTEVEQAYKQYIKDTVKLFDASGPDALDFANHLFHYESRIAEITPPESVMNDPLQSNHLISIGELSQIAMTVPWLDLLRHIFPHSKLDHRSHVLVVSREYFSDISKIISSTDRSLLNSYMVFSFVTAYMPYLSEENKRVLDLFHREFTGLKEPMERWEFCIQTTAKFFNLGLGSLYERSPSRSRSHKKNERVLTEIFNEIRYTLGSNLAASRWYPAEVKDQLSAKLNNMTLQVGYPERLLDPTVINSFYEEYTIFIKDFFQNLQDSMRNSRKQLELKLTDPMPESEWIDALSADDVSYIHEANKIVIPPHLVSPPLFHRNYPYAMLYGSIGVQIGRAMLRAVDSIGLAWNSRGQLVERTVYTNRSSENLRSLADCVSSSVMDLDVETDAVVERTASDTASEIDAVRQTYQAYTTLLKRRPQPQHPSFESLNTTNIFFMAYAGSMCSEATVQQEDIERTCSPTLMSKPRLLAVLAQLPEFSRVFSCSKDSRHYPHWLCANLH
ncbi:endothelin-converting enzyme 1-like isoform X4 [Palaemon carinicauda]|uniref:endothelin-converting enzyme 1-like isoform X4 n=1 Tax=Palaemon carinicauda TaxID=392227 RepID=UPI0035B5B4AA